MKVKLITIPLNPNENNIDIERNVNIALNGYKIKKIISFNESSFSIRIWVILEN